VRVVRATVAGPETAYLVRPPLYLTEQEYQQLCALVVAADLAPPEYFTRGQRSKILGDPFAEYCRRALLAALFGITRYPEDTGKKLRPNYVLRALQRQRVIGGRFYCRACEGRIRRKRSKKGVTIAVARWEAKAAKKREQATLARVRKLEAELFDARFDLRRALERLALRGDAWAVQKNRGRELGQRRKAA
jgi:hypothetical protein